MKFVAWCTKNCRARPEAARPPALTPLSADPDDQGVALAAAPAEGCGAHASATALELHRQRQHEARAGGADGVPERHGAAVDVDLVLVDAELPGGVQGDGGEGLVDLVEVEGGGVDAELRRWLGGGPGGPGPPGGAPDRAPAQPAERGAARAAPAAPAAAPGARPGRAPVRA